MSDNGWARIVELAETGMAVIVATADADGRPTITRGGPMPAARGRSMRLAVSAAVDSETLANLEANARIAVTLSRPTTYETFQVKGSVDTVARATTPDIDRAHLHLDHSSPKSRCSALRRVPTTYSSAISRSSRSRSSRSSTRLPAPQREHGCEQP